MARRMIDPQTIIKSQIADDKYSVDLYEILEKYGVPTSMGKSVTLQFYSKENADDSGLSIHSDTLRPICFVVENTAITISTVDGDGVYINGLLVDDVDDMNFLKFINISDEDYENGIILMGTYPFDVHVIKV
jgi:hypothetical protein